MIKLINQLDLYKSSQFIGIYRINATDYSRVIDLIWHKHNTKTN